MGTNWWEREDSPQLEDRDRERTCYFQDGERCLGRGEGSRENRFRHPDLLVVCTLRFCPEAGNLKGQKRICPNDFTDPESINPLNALKRQVGRVRNFTITGPTSTG